jgi:fatty-acid desaturase
MKSHARVVVENRQFDPGWWLVRTLEFLGLALEIKETEQVGEREGLRSLVQG